VGLTFGKESRGRGKKKKEVEAGDAKDVESNKRKKKQQNVHSIHSLVLPFLIYISIKKITTDIWFTIYY